MELRKGGKRKENDRASKYDKTPMKVEDIRICIEIY
jgi:hypothetical protein